MLLISLILLAFCGEFCVCISLSAIQATPRKYYQTVLYSGTAEAPSVNCVKNSGFFISDLSMYDD